MRIAGKSPLSQYRFSFITDGFAGLKTACTLLSRTIAFFSTCLMPIDWQGGPIDIDGNFLQTKFFKEQDVEVKKQGGTGSIFLPNQEQVITQRRISGRGRDVKKITDSLIISQATDVVEAFTPSYDHARQQSNVL